MSIESVNRALAGDRLLFLALQNNDDDDPEPDDLRQVGTIAAIRQMAKVPNGGVHVIVEGLTRARADAGHARRGTSLRGDGRAAARSDRAHARSRRVRPPPARADRSRAVGVERPVAGAARPGRRASTIRCGSPTCSSSLLDMKADEKQQILENERPHRQAAGGRRRAQPRDRAARAERQDRVGGAAGDDRRAAPVLPAPAAQGDSGRARRRREARGAGAAQAARRREAARDTSRRSPAARSIASSG